MYFSVRRFGDSERVANAARARLRGAKPTGLLAKDEEAELGMGNVEEAHAALDSVQIKITWIIRPPDSGSTLIERDYSGAKAFAEKATDAVKKTPDYFVYTLAAVAHAEGKVNEERQANTEAKRSALLALVPRPDDPKLLGELSVAKVARSESKKHFVMRVEQPRSFRWNVDAVAGPMC